MAIYRSLLEVLKFSQDRDILRHQGQVSGLWHTASVCDELWDSYSILLNLPSRLQGESGLKAYIRGLKECSVIGLVSDMEISIVNCWERTRKVIGVVEPRYGKRQATWVFVSPASFVASGGMAGCCKNRHTACNLSDLFDSEGRKALPPMITGRYNHRGVAVKGVVYLFGGNSKRISSPIASSECLNLTNIEAGWRPVPDLPYPQLQPCICSTPSHIYLCLQTENAQVLFQYEIASERYSALNLSLPAIARPSTFAPTSYGLVLLGALGEKEVVIEVDLGKGTLEVVDASDDLPKKKECEGLVLGNCLFIGYFKWVFKYDLLTRFTEYLQLS
jgi:hypothetical protein